MEDKTIIQKGQKIMEIPGSLVLSICIAILILSISLSWWIYIQPYTCEIQIKDFNYKGACDPKLVYFAFAMQYSDTMGNQGIDAVNDFSKFYLEYCKDRKHYPFCNLDNWDYNEIKSIFDDFKSEVKIGDIEIK